LALQRNSRNIPRVALAYAGALIGAGFASGQEIGQFFTAFGQDGIKGIILSGVGLGLLGSLTTSITNKHGLENYGGLLRLTMGDKGAKFFDFCISLALFVGLAVMLSGSAALFEEYLGISFVKGLVITIISLMTALAAKNGGLLWLNSLLVPLMVLIIVVVCLSAPELPGPLPPTQIMRSASPTLFAGKWWVAAILYLSFNLIAGMVILAALPGEDPRGPVLGAALLGLTGLLVAETLLEHTYATNGYEIPMMSVAYQTGPLLSSIYALALWFAMLTTAATDLFGLTQRLAKQFGKDYHLVMLGIILFSLPLVFLGFSNLVKNLYPVLGILGLPVALGLFRTGLKGMLSKY